MNKLSFKNIKGLLSRDEMRQVKGGSGCGTGYYVCHTGGRSGSSSSGACHTWAEITSHASDMCRNLGGVKSVWCFGC